MESSDGVGKLTPPTASQRSHIHSLVFSYLRDRLAIFDRIIVSRSTHRGEKWLRTQFFRISRSGSPRWIFKPNATHSRIGQDYYQDPQLSYLSRSFSFEFPEIAATAFTHKSNIWVRDLTRRTKIEKNLKILFETLRRSGSRSDEL